MIFDEVISSRRSIRHFSSQKVKMEDLCAIMETVRLTPSAKNRQPWYFTLLDEKEKEILVEKLIKEAEKAGQNGPKATALAISSAPIFILVKALRTGQTDLLSIGAAIYGLILKAADLGLGSLWIGDTDLLSQEDYPDLIGAIAIGYPDQSPTKLVRKSVEEISNLSSINKGSIAEDFWIVPEFYEENFAFISYCHANREFVIPDIIELKRHGLALWYDKALEVGEKWTEGALSHIERENCKVFFLYVSFESLSSESVFLEFSKAYERYKKGEIAIIPILLYGGDIRSILDRLKETGLLEQEKLYRSFFGEDSETIFLEKKYPQSFYHVEEAMQKCRKVGATTDITVYDDFLYQRENGEIAITGYRGGSASIKIPEAISNYPVTKVGVSAFFDMTFIKEIKLPTSIKELEAGAFRATGIESIELPFSIKTLGHAVFRDCLSLRHVELPKDITEISEALFRGCESLDEIVVPEKVVELHEAAFLGCRSLKKAVMPKGLKKMTDGCFLGCTSLVELVIPETVIGAEDFSFKDSPHLKPTRIGKYLFEHGNCHIEE